MRQIPYWGLMMSTFAMWGRPAIGAQVAYDVFPAQSAPAAITQPTGLGATARVTLEVRDSTIEYAVQTLARQAHLRPIYNNGNPLFSKRVTIHLTDVSVMDAFAVVLKGTGLAAKMRADEETVMIGAPSKDGPLLKERLATGIIVGRVVDSARGDGLAGASVKVAGIKLSAVTSDSGNFTLHDVPSGEHVLNVRLFGYRATDRTVTVVDSQRTMVRIVMASVPTVLSGVVTTATGVQRKVEIGNDISTINVDSVMRVAPISSVTDLLETRVPGLTVQHSSGVPGSPSRIRIRGVSSITGNNDPIIVVDGVRVYSSQSDPRNSNLAKPNVQSNSAFGTGDFSAPSPLDQIDPSSIETIEVFKGPSASALYGSDAANGVIVITTKHGRAGPTQWNLALGAGLNWLPGDWPTNYYRFGTTTDNALGPQCYWYNVSCDIDSIVAFQALNDPNFTVFSHGNDQDAALTVSGGSPTVQYSVTASASNTLGNLKLPGIDEQRYANLYGPVPGWMIRPDRYQTWGGNGQVTMHPLSTANVTLMSSLLNGHQQQGALQGAITQLEGNYYDLSQVLASSTPLISNDVERALDDQLTSTNAATLAWKPSPWVSFNATGGLNTIERTDQTYIPYGVNYADPSGTVDTTGSYGLGRGTSVQKTLWMSATTPSRWVTTTVGLNFQQGSTSDFSVATNQLAPGVSTPTQFMCVTNGVSEPCLSTQNTSAASTYGWYVSPQLNFNSKFFVSPGFRLDGGSASGSQAGLTGYPKIDFSYLLVDHSRPKGFVSLFRPRLALGIAGTQPGPTQKLRLFNAGSNTTIGVLNDSTTVPIALLSTAGNTQLQPERSREIEGGFDLELWNGRFSMTWSQYNKTRDNAIVQFNVPISALVCNVTGSCTQYINIGTVRNTGTEMTANIQLLDTRLVSWFVGANLSNDNNILVSVNPGEAAYGTKVNGIVVGYPLFGNWVYPITGFADANGDGVIQPSEVRHGDSLVYAGQSDPKYQVNLNTGMTLLNGRFTVNATFAYQSGMTQFNDAAITSGASRLIPNAPGTPLSVQAAMAAAGICATTCSDATDIGLMQTVNTFRFNDLSINYTLPTAVARRFRVPRMMIALQGSNLGLHTNYRGKDPSVNAFTVASTSTSDITAVGDRTVDSGQIPEPRTWWLKLTLGN